MSGVRVWQLLIFWLEGAHVFHGVWFSLEKIDNKAQSNIRWIVVFLTRKKSFGSSYSEKRDPPLKRCPREVNVFMQWNPEEGEAIHERKRRGQRE
ncbi:hypothetical protein JOB18_013938 [Solea senegalensis]|uniref:Secreted protein n=1 Tax=Solea senegalensis TaxID=28829 RepID=A0AAV6QTD6_SOLSE|nr:hypothetical protein JOB18_013938 [Solea senegalensis]